MRAREHDRGPEPRRRASRAAAHPALALQRRAGNQAVSALVTRAQTGRRAVLSGIGTIPLLSASFGDSPGRAREIHLTSTVGRHSPQLAHALAEATPIESAEIVLPGDGGTTRLKLTGALLASYLRGERGTEGWSLVYESVSIY